MAGKLLLILPVGLPAKSGPLGSAVRLDSDQWSHNANIQSHFYICKFHKHQIWNATIHTAAFPPNIHSTVETDEEITTERPEVVSHKDQNWERWARQTLKYNGVLGPLRWDGNTPLFLFFSAKRNLNPSRNTRTFLRMRSQKMLEKFRNLDESLKFSRKKV